MAASPSAAWELFCDAAALLGLQQQVDFPVPGRSQYLSVGLLMACWATHCGGRTAITHCIHFALFYSTEQLECAVLDFFSITEIFKG